VDAIALDPDTNPYVCIHCGQCIEYCPHDCLALLDADSRPAPCTESCHVPE